LEIGGERQDDIQKWSDANKGPSTRSHIDGDTLAGMTTH
jgi:hypothetical protein